MKLLIPNSLLERISQKLLDKRKKQTPAEPVRIPEEYRRWLVRTGALPESHMGVTRCGLFTDFN